MKFLLRHFITKNEVFHLARVKFYSRDDLSLHNHDFAEIFWVESGSGTHLINGRKIPLIPGDLVMIRPDDQHTFTAGRQGITIMNLAFSKKTLQHLRKRYFNGTTPWFRTNSLMPFQANLGIPVIKSLSQQASQMWKYQSSFVHLDSFLLSVFKLLIIPEEVADSPAWLNNAVQHFIADSVLFREGARGFATLCGRHIDYVNRTVHKYYNKTLSGLVNDLRMDFAGRQLSITNVPIKSICSDCGFNNIGHFYKVFFERYHLTPLQYRKQHQTIV